MKNTIIALLISILISTNLYSAGSDGGDNSSKVKSDYDKAVTYIKSAKKTNKR